MPRYIFPFAITLSLFLTACSTRASVTTSPAMESGVISTPMETRLPPTITWTVEPAATKTSLPTPTTTVGPTATRTSIPTPTTTWTSLPTSTPGPTPTPWLPVALKETCVPSETRFCKLLVVLPSKYYAEQARFTFKEFEKAGFTVFKASKAPDVVEVCAVLSGTSSKKVSIDLTLSEVRVAEYDAVIYIGGYGCKEQWQDEESHQIARDAVEQGKVLGAIGCAPTILAHAGVMVGKRSAICDKDAMVKGGKDYCKVLESLGAICGNYSIERDGLIVTAKQAARNFVDGVIQVIMENTAQP